VVNCGRRLTVDHKMGRAVILIKRLEKSAKWKTIGDQANLDFGFSDV